MAGREESRDEASIDLQPRPFRVIGDRLEGRVAVVTGASRGIGRAIALALASEGARVAINCATQIDRAGALAREITEGGAHAVAVQADLRSEAGCAALIERAKSHFGDIAILVNNAGITRDKSLRKMQVADWDDVIATNLTAAFHTTRRVLDPMIAARFGRIVNVASIIGQTGNFGQANYAASKAGLIAFSKSVAQETARCGITVNALCPGFIDTDMLANVPEEARAKVLAKIPSGRFGLPEDVAKMALFLCTDGDWITGQQLNVNGGQYM